MALQVMQTKQLQRESQARLNGFVDELRGNAGVDLSAKNLGEEGTQYISEGLAFNDRFDAQDLIMTNEYKISYMTPIVIVQ